jgi:hypothetical protein
MHYLLALNLPLACFLDTSCILLIRRTADKGLVIFCPCLVTRITTAVHTVMKETGETRIYAILGCFLFENQFFERVDSALWRLSVQTQMLRNCGMEMLILGTGTGTITRWLLEEFPETVWLSSVGTTYALGDSQNAITCTPETRDPELPEMAERAHKTFPLPADVIGVRPESGRVEGIASTLAKDPVDRLSGSDNFSMSYFDASPQYPHPSSIPDNATLRDLFPDCPIAQHLSQTSSQNSPLARENIARLQGPPMSDRPLRRRQSVPTTNSIPSTEPYPMVQYRNLNWNPKPRRGVENVSSRAAENMRDFQREILETVHARNLKPMPAREGLNQIYAAQELERASPTTAVEEESTTPPLPNMQNVIRDLVVNAEPDPRDLNPRVSFCRLVYSGQISREENGEPFQNGTGGGSSQTEAGVEPSQNEAGAELLPEEASNRSSEESYSAWSDLNDDHEQVGATLGEQQDVDKVPEEDGEGPTPPTHGPNASADTLIGSNTPQQPDNNIPVRCPCSKTRRVRTARRDSR